MPEVTWNLDLQNSLKAIESSLGGDVTCRYRDPSRIVGIAISRRIFDGRYGDYQDVSLTGGELRAEGDEGSKETGSHGGRQDMLFEERLVSRDVPYIHIRCFYFICRLSHPLSTYSRECHFASEISSRFSRQAQSEADQNHNRSIVRYHDYHMEEDHRPRLRR